MSGFVVGEVIGGGVLKLERVRVICPACGQQVEAVATDGRVKGYCTVAKQYVDFPIAVPMGPQANTVASVTAATAAHKGKHLPAEHRAKLSAALKKRWQDPGHRAKQSVALKKRWQDTEYRAKISAALTGKHPTAETRAKISASIRRWHNKRG